MSVRNLIIAAAIIAVAYLGVRYLISGPESGGQVAGAPLVQVSVPALSGAAKEGEALFNAKCAQCQGDTAAGNEAAGPPLVHIIYEPNHHSDAAFHLAAKQGVRAHHWQFGNMAPVESVSEADIEKILAYVRTLQRENGIN